MFSLIALPQTKSIPREQRQKVLFRMAIENMELLHECFHGWNSIVQFYLVDDTFIYYMNNAETSYIVGDASCSERSYMFQLRDPSYVPWGTESNPMVRCHTKGVCSDECCDFVRIRGQLVPDEEWMQGHIQRVEAPR